MPPTAVVPPALPAAAARPALSLRAQLRLAFGLPSLLVVVVALIALWGFTQLRQSAHQAIEVDGGLSRLADRVAVTALQVRRFEREYFLDIADASRRNQHLQRWQQASGELYIALNNLEVAIVAPADREQVAEWQATYATYREGFDRVRLQIETGAITRPDQASAALDPERENIASVTDRAVALAERKTVSAQQTAAALGRESDRLVWLLVISGAVAIVASVGWSLFFPARLTRPISALSSAAQGMSRGDMSLRVSADRADELGLLAASFNQMAATIERQLSDLDTQYQAARAARDAAQAAEAGMAAQLQTIAAQREMIDELSVPILPLSAATLVLPLVGALDSNRLSLTMERALHAIEQAGARHLILDITGVPIIDTQVAAGLIQVVQAARLLGTQVVLVGVRPEVAQAVVGLGVDFGEIVTRSSLQGGIEYTLRPTSGGRTPYPPEPSKLVTS